MAVARGIGRGERVQEGRGIVTSASLVGDGSKRAWSDPSFFALLAAIGGTYVLLIVAMLAADALYLLTGSPDIPVSVDFDMDAHGKAASHEARVSDLYQGYGLTIELAEGSGSLQLIDTGKVPWQWRHLGTPHVDFGGPGMGKGGVRRQATQNNAALGRVLVVTEPSGKENWYECRFDFSSPSELDGLRFSAPLARPVQLTVVTEDGQELTRSVAASIEHDKWQGPSAQHVLVGAPWDFGGVEIEFASRRRATARTSGGTAVRQPSLRTFVADPKLGRLRPVAARRVVRFRWTDAVALDEVTLLNCLEPAIVTLRDTGGETVHREKISATGPNGVREVVFEKRGVAEVAIELPPEAAIAELRFRWSGKVLSDWERRHPRLARWASNPLVTAFGKPEIRYSIKLTLIACTITTILSLWVAVPVGYLLSRYRFPLHNLIDAILDIPIVLPPLVVGLSLLILFQFFPRSVQSAVVYEIPAVILAQFAVACAFAVRSMRGSFLQIDRRREQVALTLGCTRAQAFFYVVLPEAGRGMLTAGTLAWARALGEFGPLLVFAGATRMKTEVLSTTVFLELSVGDLGAAVAVSLIMVASAIVVLILARMWGSRVLSI